MKEYIVHVPKHLETNQEEIVSFFGEPIIELIRCKDCEHLKVTGELEHTNGDATFYYICDYWHRATDEWRYCDDGARRKEDDDD